jgi:hypothetical protein
MTPVYNILNRFNGGYNRYVNMSRRSILARYYVSRINNPDYLGIIIDMEYNTTK